MGTVSTKSRARKARRARSGTLSPDDARSSSSSPLQKDTGALSDYSGAQGETLAWLWPSASILLLAVGAFLRLYDYSLKPFHHDEGVNGFFLINLFRNHVYHYDPSNYHGPTLYYFSLLTSLLFGLNDFAVRFVPALFGVATIWLMLLLRRYIGTFGALAAAALLAVSPGAVFYSRYFIHESHFVFFSVAMVVAALRYYETTRIVYLLLVAASAALLFATKETAMITAGVFIIALLCTEVYQRLRGTRGRALEGGKKRRKQQSRYGQQARPVKLGIHATLARFGQTQDLIWYGAAALALFILIHILFYSSFFTHAKGVNDSLATFKIWVRTGTSEFHAKPWGTYLYWLWQEESLLLLLGLAGVMVAAVRATNRFVVFVSFWALGIIAAYSLVPYKTPWLVLNFIPPLVITGGYALNALYQHGGKGPTARALALAVLLLAVSVGSYQTVVLNFYQYDNEQYPYVYAHTQRGYLSLIKEIKGAAERAGTRGQTTISIASPDYWPMPWYLREFKSVAYPGRPGSHTEQIVVCNNSQEAECQAMLGGRYRRAGSFPLRSGIMLVLYLRNDVP